MNKKLNIIINCGEKTCLDEFGRSCIYLQEIYGGQPKCTLFRGYLFYMPLPLKVIKEHVQRCNKCLASEVKNNV